MRTAPKLALTLVLTAACTTPAQPRDAASPDGSTVTAPNPQSPTPPVAERRAHAVESPHGTRDDPYYWLRDDKREDADMLAYLVAENRYRDAMLSHLDGLRKTLFDEIVGRIKQDDSSVPYKYRDYRYYRRYEPGKEYAIYARRKAGKADGPEQIMLDANELAKGHDFYQIGNSEISPGGQQLLAYAEDTVGRRKYTIRFKDLETGQTLPDRIEGTSGSMTWALDDRTLFYIERDPVTLLGVRVKKHVLGTDPAEDPVVYEEKDHSFYMGVSRTSDDAYVVIGLDSTVSNEYRYVRADKPDAPFEVFLPRERDHEHDVDHIGKRWIVRTNWEAKNFRLMEVSDRRVGDRKKWTELVPHRPGILVGSFALFDDYLVMGEQGEGLRRIRVRDWKGKREFLVESDEPAYSAYIGVNAETDTSVLRYGYTSLTTPSSVFEVDMKTGERTLLKQDPVLGGFDAANYQTERQWAVARDGTKVPVSIVYRKGFKKDGTAPLYQYSYGSYGSSSDPSFRSSILSLLDRGFVFAVAHIRGGQEMGREWYDDGKLLNKKNTFTDFIDVTKFLVEQKYAAPDKVVAMGGSAGGLLMGAVANMAPDAYRAIVAHVPFVDVVTTMLDESIPLTTNEFDEWGNPKQKPYYDYMLSYSPYDNVEAKAYPAMLVTTGLWDSQVQYFEPAKWVAKLRATKTDSNDLILHVNMDAGHGGKSGRFRRQEERALEYAFVLDQVGLADPPSAAGQ